MPEESKVIPITRKSKKAARRSGRSRRADSAREFSRLAARLDKSLGKIEKDLQESLELLETDLQGAVRLSKKSRDDKKIAADIDALAKQLENRVHRTLRLLTLQSSARTPLEDERLKMVNHIRGQLMRVLSFDFYKSVVDRLKLTEMDHEVDPFGMDERFIRNIKPIFDYLYYRYWRVTTTGINNIPDTGRALIVGNHSGTIPYDGAMIKTAIINEHPKRKDARFLVEDFVYHMPFLGSFMYRIGGVRASPENAETLLASHHLVIVFPEGVKGIGKYYRDRYKLQRFGRGGFIRICMKTKSPLVPVGIIGAEEIHPIIVKSNIIAKTIGVPYIPVTPTFPLLGLLGCIPLPSKWSLHFGKPVDFTRYGEQGLQDDLLINRLSEQIRHDIQEILYELLRKRRSVWLG